MPYTVILSSVGSGLVRRFGFPTYDRAAQFASRFAPTGSRRAGYRVEIYDSRECGRTFRRRRTREVTGRWR
jgi:hypothetical protein